MTKPDKKTDQDELKQKLQNILDDVKKMGPTIRLNCLCYSPSCQACGFNKADREWEKQRDKIVTQYESIFKTIL